MNKEKLREAVFLSLGRVSMCWSEIPQGVFDDAQAVQIGNEVMQAIDEYVASLLEDAQNRGKIDLQKG